MSTFDHSPGSVSGQSLPESGTDFHTGLISKLVNELYADAPHSAAARNPSGKGNGHSGLEGVYPSAAPSNVPPVHPSVEPLGQTQGGKGDSPESLQTYAFGEPHVNDDLLRGRHAADTSLDGHHHANGGAVPVVGAPAGIKHEDPYAAPDFYFLPRHEVTAQSSPFERHSLPSGLALSPFDVEAVRRDFPALHQTVNGRQLVWLDNAATTHKPQAVIDATSYYYARDNSNIHRAAHTLAARSTDAFEAGREKVRRFVGAADAKEIVFVRGTTEAINLVAQSYGRANIGPGDEIIVSTIEHHANIVPWQLLTQQTGAVLRVAPVNDRGELILEQFATLLSGRTKIVSITQVANSLGTVNPIQEVIALSHAYGVPVLVDAAQSTPHMPVNVQLLDADFLVFSGHKVFGPTGIGALYGKAHLLEAMPPWQGGGHMIKDVTFAKTSYNHAPEKFEAGTPDIAGVVGLGAAVDYLLGIGLPAISAYEHELLEYATEAIQTVPGLRIIGTAAHKASVLSFVVEGHDPEKIGVHLDKYGIAARAGHHCAQPALRRFGVEKTVRASLAFYNTREEVDLLVRALNALPNK